MNKILRAPLARLFQKFFLAIFLSQLLAVVGVGYMIWAVGPEPHLPEPEERVRHDEPGPPPPAAATLAADAAGTTTPRPALAPDDRAPSQLPPPDDRAASQSPPPHWSHPPERDRYLFGHRTHRHGYPFLPVGIGLLASLLSAFLLARQFAGPILALRSAFTRLGQGDLRVRLGPGPGRRTDELEALRADFDLTAAKLERLVEGQRRLLHDVSHEIRSPVARLQLALDLIRQQPGRASELLDRMERECGRIDRLMEELLTLSRLEAGAFGPLDQAVDLVEIVQGVVEDAGFEGAARGVTVALEAPAMLDCRGHAELLHRAIENVVRNAVAHSPDRGHVRVTVAVDGVVKRLRVVVEDAGRGVPPEDLERIFAPFKRLANFSLLQAAGGHGLGLAITREAMLAHGGRAFAENRAGGGLSVTLEMPWQEDGCPAG